MKLKRILFLSIAVIAASVFLYYQKMQIPQNIVNTSESITNNKLIFNNSGDENIQIEINPATELDYLTKEEVFNIRKQHVALVPEIIDQDYTPSEAVFGQLIDGKPWWGLNGLNCYANSEKSIDGLSEESCFINNPLLLIGFLPNGAFSIPVNTCNSSCNTPIVLSFQPQNKKIVAVQDVKKFYEENIYSNNISPKVASLFQFKADNARDFGYDYIFADNTENISFTDSENATNIVYKLRDFMHMGGSCGYPGGCNNGSPHQKELVFEINSLPAKINFKLWKNKPEDQNSSADLNYEIIFR